MIKKKERNISALVKHEFIVVTGKCKGFELEVMQEMYGEGKFYWFTCHKHHTSGMTDLNYYDNTGQRIFEGEIYQRKREFDKYIKGEQG